MNNLIKEVELAGSVYSVAQFWVWYSFRPSLTLDGKYMWL